MRTIKVFLSGTRRDLGAYWVVAADAVRSVEGYQASAMDDNVATPITVDQWSRREATIPDLYVALLGKCYGHVPMGQDRSLTEQEYDVAGQVGLDRLVFLTDDSDAAVVASESAIAHDAIDRFRAKVKGHVVFDRVESPPEFRERLIRALREWERRTLRGATTSADHFYRPWLDGTPDFGHQDELFARDRELAELERFAGSAQRLLVLEGSWGQGKSRLLLELAMRLGKSVRFVKEEAPLSRAALAVSAVDPSVIVLEDVQRRSAEDRRRLLSLVRRFGPDVKLVITSRTANANAVLEDVRQAGYEAEDIVHLVLEPLADREHRQLIARLLGSDSEEAHIIAQRTRGSTLAGVVTARMFRRGAVTLGQIESSNDFRHAVLRSFETALREQATQGADQRFSEMLRLVAVAGPFRTDDDDAVAALAAHLGWRPHVVRSTLSDMVDADLLIRRGRLVRVPVDAIAEDIRRQACVNPRGESLGYAEDALARLWPVLGGVLLRNLAALAWDLRQEGVAVDLLDAFWPRATAAYDSAPASQRLRLLEDLEEVAPYAPTKALEFVRHAHRSGLGPEEEQEFLRGQIPLHRIHDRLSKLLEGVLHHAEHVGEACDLLWVMAEHDDRDPKKYTSSSRRILEDTGKYRPRTDIARYQALLRWAQRRNGGADPIPAHLLVRYIRPLLDREVEYTWSDDEAIHMSARGLSAKALGDLRCETLDLLEQFGLGTQLVAVAAALDGIGHTLTTPPAGFGRVPTREEVAQWHPEELSSLGRIQRIRAAHASRVVDLCVLREVGWVAEHSEHVALREQAAAMVADIREALAGTIELALSRAYQLYRDSDESHAEAHDRDVARIAEVHGGSSAAKIASTVRATCTSMEEARCNPEPTALLHHIARLNPDLGDELVSEALVDPSGVLARSIGGILGGLAETDPPRAISVSERVLQSAKPQPLRALAYAYQLERFVDRIGQGAALSHLERLLCDPDRWVRENALAAIGFRENLPQADRLRLLLGYDLATSPSTGEEWAQALGRGKLTAECTDDQLSGVAKTLRDAADLEFWSCELVELLARRVPNAVVEMLVSRVGRAGTEGLDAALDPTQKDPLAPLPEAAREGGMIALGAYLGDEDFRVAHAAADLFAKLATGDRELMRRVRLTWIGSGEPKLIWQAAESLSYEESEFLLEEEAIVVSVLQAAEAQGHDLLQRVEARLYGVASRGIRTGTPGEPFTRDVVLRDGARAIAGRHLAGSLANRFYVGVVKQTQDTIDRLRRRHDELSE